MWCGVEMRFGGLGTGVRLVGLVEATFHWVPKAAGRSGLEGLLQNILAGEYNRGVKAPY